MFRFAKSKCYRIHGIHKFNIIVYLRRKEEATRIISTSIIYYTIHFPLDKLEKCFRAHACLHTKWIDWNDDGQNFMQTKLPTTRNITTHCTIRSDYYVQTEKEILSSFWPFHRISSCVSARFFVDNCSNGITNLLNEKATNDLYSF